MSSHTLSCATVEPIPAAAAVAAAPPPTSPPNDSGKEPPTETESWAVNDSTNGVDFGFSSEQFAAIETSRSEWLAHIGDHFKKNHKKKAPALVKWSKHARLLDGNNTLMRGQIARFADGTDLPFLFPDSCQEDVEEPLSKEEEANRLQLQEDVLAAMQSQGSLSAGDKRGPAAAPKNPMRESEVETRRRLKEGVRRKDVERKAREVAFLKAKLAAAMVLPADVAARKKVDSGFVIHSMVEGKATQPLPGFRAQFALPLCGGAGILVSYIALAGEEDKKLIDRLVRAFKDKTLRILYQHAIGAKITDNDLLTLIAMGEDLEQQTVINYCIAKCKNPGDMPGTLWLQKLPRDKVKQLEKEKPDDYAVIMKEAQDRNWNGYEAAPYIWDPKQTYNPYDKANKPLQMEDGPLKQEFDKIRAKRAAANGSASGAAAKPVEKQPAVAAAASGASPPVSPPNGEKPASRKVRRKMKEQKATSDKQAASIEASMSSEAIVKLRAEQAAKAAADAADEADAATKVAQRAVAKADAAWKISAVARAAAKAETPAAAVPTAASAK